jgi:hypothetical protein
MKWNSQKSEKKFGPFLGPDAFYDYYYTRRPQKPTKVSFESARQVLSNDTLVAVWRFFSSEEQNSQKSNQKFGEVLDPDAFYDFYYTRRPQMPTKASFKSARQALSSDTLVVVWGFFSSEELNSQKSNQKYFWNSWTQTPFTTTTTPENPRSQPRYLSKALDKRSRVIPWLPFGDFFQVRNEIPKSRIRNMFGILWPRHLFCLLLH